MPSIPNAARLIRSRLRAWRNRHDCRFVLRAQRAAHGRRFLITGATSGIGEAAAIALVRCGAFVLVHGRSQERLAQTVGRLSSHARHGARVWSYRADLSDPLQLDDLMQRIRQDHPLLDGLVNNAGVGVVPERRVDGRGIEWVWAVNVLAPWRLAQGLAPLLAQAESPRILNLVSSLTHDLGDDLMLERGYDPILAYGRSKQAMIVVTAALAEAFDARRIAVLALDPGSIDTPMFAGFGLDYSGMPPAQAGNLVARMIADPGLSGESKRLYRVGRAIEMPPQAHDAALRERLVASLRRQSGG